MNNSPKKDGFSLATTLKKEWYIILLILGTLALGLYLYPDLPDKMPSHWNIHGEVDDWSSKSFGVWFFPLLNLGLYLLLLVIPYIDPRRQNYQRFQGAYWAMRLLLHIFLAGLYILTLLVSLGYPLKVDFFVKFSVSLLFLLIGNYMGKIKHNYFVGFKTPWTLASEEVWYKTHRFGAPLWVGAGLLGMILSFIDKPWASYTLFGAFILMAFIPMVYSYLLYRRIHNA